MKENDFIQRFMFDNIAVRGEWVRLTDSYRTIVTQHKYPPLVQKLLGEMLVIAVMLSAIVKFTGRLTVQFQGKSKLKLLMAQCDNEFNIRGLAQWLEEFTEEELTSLFTNGVMVITIDPVKGGQRYQGIVSWEGDTLTHSIEGYFKTSEQLPTRLWVSVDETNATGMLLQVMPRDGSKPETGDSDWEHLIHLTNTITPHELHTLDPLTLLRRLYVEEEVRVFQPNAIRFNCQCSVERCENALRILGREEAEQELKTKQVIVVTCDFCSKEYTFDKVDIAKVFIQGDKPPSSTQLH